MLKRLLFITSTILLSCSNGKEVAAEKKKVVCADSFEEEQFDAQGNSYMVKKAGECDTVLENPAH